MNPIRQHIRVESLSEVDCPVMKVTASLSITEQSWISNVHRDHAKFDLIRAEEIRLEDRIVAKLYGNLRDELLKLKRDVQIALGDSAPAMMIKRLDDMIKVMD